jgi:membrane protein required for colicin V production
MQNSDPVGPQKPEQGKRNGNRTMTWVDAVAISIIILSALFSLVRGFVREMLGVAAWLGAAFAALRGYQYVQPYVASLVTLKSLIIPISIGIVFIVTLIILSIISAWVGGLVRDSALSSLDRSLGLVFGAIRGAVILSLGYIGLSMFVAQTQWPAPVVNARLLPYAYDGASFLAGLIPPTYRPTVLSLPSTPPPSANSLMQPPVAGSALRTE